ncbi:HAMP domain-containing histidine kinase [Paenibacillus rhizovicinus]|uniref:histidine kinase n=1 Tax=Paenibacillus rhizovicinus TaxID=2704463 RepID=A0A6C0PAC6_9BACL|nr:HAMP domain-containing sensor histidine kinase [Paenibacillus rhizovicinus]QHW34593.1 HAMP domain-containing histidine kinase [Paenibacillus rhizovicinus]
MIFYFFALLAAGAVLLLSQPRRETNRWAAFFLACAAIGGLENAVRDAGWTHLADTVVYVNQTCTPFGIFVFSLVYAGYMPRNRSRAQVLKLALLLPAACMLAVTPLRPILKLDFVLLLCWVGPYYIFSCYVLLRALWKESDAGRRRNRLVTTLIVVPSVLAALAFINVARAIEPDFDFFNYISVFIIYSLAMALLCVFIYGFLGVKLRIERDPLDASMQAVSSGTTMINHSIKNEIGKISLSTLNLRHHLPDADAETKQHLAIIAQSSAHMLDMVTRIHHRTRAVVLHEELCALDVIAQRCLDRYAGLLEENGITAAFSPLERPALMIDPIHVQEAIGNLILNAIEAMDNGGHVQLMLDGDKKYVTLAVADNGPGIPKELLGRVMEPFFSTKSDVDNYGLGLSYVYNVMALSGGTLEIGNDTGSGTRARLKFPRKKRTKG